jgi:hypothetical protein
MMANGASLSEVLNDLCASIDAHPRCHFNGLFDGRRVAAIAPRPFHAGNHARDLFARDSGRPASRSRERREVPIWTQMDPSSVFGATSVKQSELKIKMSDPTHR